MIKAVGTSEGERDEGGDDDASDDDQDHQTDQNHDLFLKQNINIIILRFYYYFT